MIKVSKDKLREVLDALTCCEDHPHWCTHCDDYVDRDGSAIATLRSMLEQPSEPTIKDDLIVRRIEAQLAKNNPLLDDQVNRKIIWLGIFDDKE